MEHTTRDDVAAPLLLSVATTTTVYALILNRIHDKYTPDWTWLTVVGGNVQIGLWFALWEHISPLPKKPLAAFWRLLAVNLAAGLPIIAWQLGQNQLRPQLRRRDDRDQDTRRPAAY
jgi:hypothetical protein